MKKKVQKDTSAQENDIHPKTVTRRRHLQCEEYTQRLVRLLGEKHEEINAQSSRLLHSLRQQQLFVSPEE